MRYSGVALFLLCLTLSAPSTRAADGTPAAKLAVLQRVLATENKNNAKYRAASTEAATILRDMQQKLVRQTDTLRRTERAAAALNAKQADTAEQVATSRQTLQRQHATLAQLVMAAQRLQRVPPEAMLLRPGTPVEAARTHLLLQRATPDIARKSHILQQELARLAALQDDLATQGAELAHLRGKQAAQQKTLTAAIATRQALLDAVQQQTAQSDAMLAGLKRQEAGLKKILADLARRPPPALNASRKKPARDHTPTADTEERPGWGKALLSIFKGGTPAHRTLRLPVTGELRTGYNEKLASGVRSQGLSIAGTPNGIVTCPRDGTVRFAGPFRQYRLLVIIEHANGLHSLLGGLHDVYHRPGDVVAAGEPIGKLDSDAALANLYYEVRQDGKPVDPGTVRG